MTLSLDCEIAEFTASQLSPSLTSTTKKTPKLAISFPNNTKKTLKFKSPKDHQPPNHPTNETPKDEQHSVNKTTKDLKQHSTTKTSTSTLHDPLFSFMTPHHQHPPNNQKKNLEKAGVML